jgi:hypothetical protein
VRLFTAIAVLVATVATALVGVRQQGENRRLERQVWEAMRRRDSLAKQIREVRTAIDTKLAPRSLLEQRDRRSGLARGPTSEGEDDR